MYLSLGTNKEIARVGRLNWKIHNNDILNDNEKMLVDWVSKKAKSKQLPPKLLPELRSDMVDIFLHQRQKTACMCSIHLSMMKLKGKG